MTGEALQTYLTALASSLTIGVIIPLLILGLMVAAAWRLLSRAQADPHFNISDVLLDDGGKVSSERLLLLATWGSTTWVLSVVVFALPQHVVEVLITYMGVWGTNNAAKAFFRHKYGAAEAQPGQPPQPPQQ